MSISWMIGFDGPVWKSGEYDPFKVGDVRQFALQAALFRDIKSLSDQSPTASYLSDCEYEANAKIIYSSTEINIIDFGVKAYAEADFDELEVGQMMTAKFVVKIDYFAYHETYCLEPNIPALIYTWQIESIDECSAPRIPMADGPGWTFNKSQVIWRPVQSTEEGQNDSTLFFALKCSKLDVAPTWTFSLSTDSN